MNNKPIIILTGPTAVGKSSLSIKLAKLLDGEIVSADSMQVYKKMNIGTAKITESEMESVRHHMIDVLNPQDPFSVALFCEMASKCIDDIYERGKLPIIVGGTGFYIQALLYGIDFSLGDENEEYRNELYRFYEDNGVTALHNRLKEIDEESYNTIHENNVKRVIRALEFYHETGIKISDYNKTQRIKESEYNFAYFVINDDRDKIYQKINERVDKMVRDGLFDEVKMLIDEGYTSCQSMLGIGYKEVVDYYNGITGYEEAIDNIKKETRHYAKKQLTWFKREKEVIYLDKNVYQNDEKMLEKILLVLEEKNIYSIH